MEICLALVYMHKELLFYLPFPTTRTFFCIYFLLNSLLFPKFLQTPEFHFNATEGPREGSKPQISQTMFKYIAFRTLIRLFLRPFLALK